MKSPCDLAIQSARFATLATYQARELSHDALMREFWQWLEHGRMQAVDDAALGVEQSWDNWQAATLAHARHAARLARDARRTNCHITADRLIYEVQNAVLAAARCAGYASSIQA